MKRHLLFVCSSNLDRSPASASLFKDNKKYESKSCGILPHAETVISEEAIKWADIIFCMEHEHKAFIFENFQKAIKKEIIVLNVPNTFERNNPELIDTLKNKLANFLDN